MEFVAAALLAVQTVLTAYDVSTRVRTFLRHRSAPGVVEPEWIPPTTELLVIVPTKGIDALVCAYFALRQASDERWHDALQQAYSVVLQHVLGIAVNRDVCAADPGWPHEVAHKLATDVPVSQEEIEGVLLHQAFAIALGYKFGIEGGYSPRTDDGPESLPI